MGGLTLPEWRQERSGWGCRREAGFGGRKWEEMRKGKLRFVCKILKNEEQGKKQQTSKKIKLSNIKDRQES